MLINKILFSIILKFIHVVTMETGNIDIDTNKKPFISNIMFTL